MKKTNMLIIVIIAIILIAVIIASWFVLSSAKSDWKAYNNTRFGIAFDYPAEWEKDDYYMGTVVTLISPDVCVLNAIIANTTENATLEKFTADALEILGRDVAMFNLTNISITELNGNEARTIFYTGAQGELDMRWMQTWTIYDNKEYVITYTTEEYKFQKCLPEINSIISSVRIG
ncbi:MAG: hypothetical protein HZB65_00250 [Candidatus Aenigmarchaeota archaeon]|nr:hypothetical protein [Candidatus Aenigmarchaeota archaeon]